MNIQSALVRTILEQWRSYTWTLQGFGFIRTKIADVGRIHVWDSRAATPLVSTLHTHPWPLRSTIISGELINQRVRISEDGAGLPYHYAHIETGEGGGLVGDVLDVTVHISSLEFHVAGSMYSQAAEEIHRTIAEPGTVTLLERPQGPPLEEALVFWPRGTTWVSAEPRPALDWEVKQTVDYALERWFAV